MKFLTLMYLSAILLSCGLSVGPATTFIPGTYIRFSEHELGKEYDTLLITLQNGEVGKYRITRRWRYERVVDGQPLEPEYRIRTTTAVYEPARKLLLENETRDNYSFNPELKLLFKGHTKYQKL